MGNNTVIGIPGDIKLIALNREIRIYTDPELGILRKGIFIIADIVKHLFLSDIRIGLQAHGIGKVHHIFA